MKKQELMKSTQLKIEEINVKLQELRDRISQMTDAENSKKAESAIKSLEEVRNDIQQRYHNLRESKSLNEQYLSEMDKNIYNSITSFKDAFSKAGGIFKTKI